jgi:hypothetical protein
MHVIALNLGGTVVGGFRSADAAEEHLRANGWTPPERDTIDWTKGPHQAFVLGVFRSLSEIK